MVTSCSTSTSPRYAASWVNSTCVSSIDSVRRISSSRRRMVGERYSHTTGGRGSGPARLPVARLGNEDRLGAELQHRAGFGRLVRFGESEQVDVEPARRLTQQVEDADRASVRQRIREVWRKDRDAATPGGRRPPLQNTVS